MKLSKVWLALFPLTLLYAAAASAAGIDMDDPRRALGREGDVRIDAQLLRDTVSPNSTIVVTYQVQNLSTAMLAIADKVADSSYDEETRTITVALGSEVPPDGSLPHMTVVRPGETKVLQSTARAAMTAAAMRASMASVPRYVQVKVAVLRDVTPFAPLIDQQQAKGARHRLSDELFDRWIESSDTIFLNAIPVRFTPGEMSDAERREPRGGF
jgi:hypothetical protein